MVALTTHKATQSRGPIILRSYPMDTAANIYAGSLVMLDSDGFARSATALASNRGCVGIATETVDNTGADGAFSITVQEGEFLMVGTSVTQAMVGAILYASDDQTVDETQGSNEPIAGTLSEFVSTTSCWMITGLAHCRTLIDLLV